MPTYDYHCRACKNVFEVFHGINELPSLQCSQCQGAVEKMVGAGSGIIFRGTGFYTTDYNRSDAYKKAAKQEQN